MNEIPASGPRTPRGRLSISGTWRCSVGPSSRPDDVPLRSRTSRRSSASDPAPLIPNSSTTTGASATPVPAEGRGTAKRRRSDSNRGWRCAGTRPPRHGRTRSARRPNSCRHESLRRGRRSVVSPGDRDAWQVRLSGKHTEKQTSAVVPFRASSAVTSGTAEAARWG